MSDYCHRASIYLATLVTWLWTRSSRKVLVLVIIVALMLLLAHMTPPVAIHVQHIHLVSSD